MFYKLCTVLIFTVDKHNNYCIAQNIGGFGGL